MQLRWRQQDVIETVGCWGRQCKMRQNVTKMETWLDAGETECWARWGETQWDVAKMET